MSTDRPTGARLDLARGDHGFAPADAPVPAEVPAGLPIHVDQPEQLYHALGEVRARVTASTTFSAPPTLAAVDAKLRARATAAGGTAIVDVHYVRTRGWATRRTLTAIGTAVLLNTRDPAVTGEAPSGLH